MVTIAKQLTGAVALLLFFSLSLPEVFGQGFTVGPGLNLGGGLGGGGFAAPGGAGFQPPAGQGGKQTGFNPTINLLTNPYGGPVGTMTSQSYTPPPPPSDYGGYGNVILPDPYGGYLKGAAAVIDSQGRYLISVQQAYLEKEKVKAAQLASRRAAYEEWLWERANLPTLEDERQRVAREQYRRAQNDPPLPEVWSGQALNVLLQNVQTMVSKKQGPSIALDEEVINKINLNSGKAGINFGLLKNEGNLTWPLALRDLQPADQSKELRDQLQTLSKQAVGRAKEGQVDPGTIREMEATVDKLNKMLVKNVGDMPFGQYSEGKRYVSQLYDGIKALREPNAADFANGKFKVKGNTVADLLDYMTKNGLQFAPAVAGEEGAYVALHRALVAYAQAAQPTLERER
jgi:hypothetical protein